LKKKVKKKKGVKIKIEVAKKEGFCSHSYKKEKIERNSVVGW
jgi:predicted metal-dependent RNase